MAIKAYTGIEHDVVNLLIQAAKTSPDKDLVINGLHDTLPIHIRLHNYYRIPEQELTVKMERSSDYTVWEFSQYEVTKEWQRDYLCPNITILEKNNAFEYYPMSYRYPQKNVSSQGIYIMDNILIEEERELKKTEIYIHGWLSAKFINPSRRLQNIQNEMIRNPGASVIDIGEME